MGDHFGWNTQYGQYIWELGVFRDIAASKDAFKALQEKEYIRYDDLPLETQDGRVIAVEFVSNVYLVDHGRVVQCNIRDITMRKQADAERRRLLAAIEQSADSIVMTDSEGKIQFVNPAFERITGYTRAEALGQNPRILKSSEQTEPFYRDLWETISNGRTWAGRIVNKRKDGSLYTEETTISPVRDHLDKIVNYVAVKRDVTEKIRLAAQFFQSQKMEAVGLLAGGVAHDYNNMLTVILGYTELAMGKVASDDAVRADLEEVVKAARRSSEITQQLLTFSRKQPVVPVVLDLNLSVESMLKMLSRLIGENITLSWLPEIGPCPVKIDPVQVDQIMANLCVNARDAISDVGKVTIQTTSAVIDAAFCAHNSGVLPGDFVQLTVSDNGCGMDEETLAKIFEPFFTSKPMGKGTGLGLSTVYGIVKQNNGFIEVSSEPGKGTSFRIYLPRCAVPMISQGKRASLAPSGHGETVLVVEDEPALLMMCKTMLDRLGYRTLVASTPSEAIALAEEHASELCLLITDVIMPEMNGRDLAKRLQSTYRNMKTLFMSGYASDVLADQGKIENGINFLQKPFILKTLAVKVLEALRT